MTARARSLQDLQAIRKQLEQARERQAAEEAAAKAAADDQRRFDELKTFVADFFGTARGNLFNRDEGMDVHLHNTWVRRP